jgi:predicted phosphodiesterase
VAVRYARISLVPIAVLGPACRAQKYEPNVTSLQLSGLAPSAPQQPEKSINTAREVSTGVISTADSGTPQSSTADGGTPHRAFLGERRPMVRVALIGDQGLGPRSEAVIDLIREASADLVVVLGDFDYVDKPRAWFDQMARLGKVPWFAVIGNHDLSQWPQYQKLIAERQAQIEDAECEGTPGTRTVCSMRGLTLVLSGVGTIGDQHEHEVFIKDALRKSKDRWKLCLWHKNQHDMQVGAKTDEVGWAAYKACQSAGAIVATGHEHSYARTRTLTAIGEALSGHGATGVANELEVGPGRNFVVVSGLGGVETRAFASSHDKDVWWAAYFTANRQKANGTVTEVSHGQDGAGALFLDFGIDGDKGWGRGRFVTAFDHRVFDDFTIRFQ